MQAVRALEALLNTLMQLMLHDKPAQRVPSLVARIMPAVVSLPYAVKVDVGISVRDARSGQVLRPVGTTGGGLSVVLTGWVGVCTQRV